MSPSVTSPRLRFLSKTTFTFLILVAATALLATGKIALGGIGSDVDVGVSKSALDSEANESDVTAFTIVVTNSGPGDATGVEITDVLPAGLSPIVGLAHVADSDTILLWQFAETNLLDTPGGVFDDAEDSGPNDLDGRAFDDGLDRTPQTVEADVAGIEGGSGIEFFFHAQPALKQFERATMLSPDVPDSIWGDGDFTVEMWVTDISNAELAGTDPDFGRFLAAQGRWQWALSITTNGAFKVRTGSTFDTDPLTWDANTWYYVALVADTSGAGAGQALYSVYRAAMGSPLALIGSGVLDDIPNANDENFHFGSGTSAGPSSRILDFVGDELHYSRVARSEGYLRALSGTITTAGSYDSGTGVWTLGGLLNGGTATLELGASVDGGTAGTTITNLASVTAVNENDTNPGNDQSEASVRVPGADLAVIKSVDNAAAGIGDTVVLTVTVTNNGPDAATRVMVRDALPLGISAFHVADSDTLVHWHFAETAASPGFPDTADSGPLGLNGDIYNDGLGPYIPKTTFMDANGLAGSGIEFAGKANRGPNLGDAADYRSTVLTFALTTNHWSGGSFTSEMWVKGISNEQIESQADGNFGAYLMGQGRLGQDWALSIVWGFSKAGFMLRINRGPDTSNEVVRFFGSNSVDFDPSTWYYIALVSDTAGQTPGKARYTVYRRTGTGEGGFEVIQSRTMDEVVGDGGKGGDYYFAGSSFNPGLICREIDYTADEVHYSRVARSQAYLESNSVLQAGATQGAYGDGGIWDVGDLAVGASASLVITARMESAFATNVAEIFDAVEGDPNPGNNTAGVMIGTDPDMDTDGDGMPDFWEQLHFGGPAAGVATADDDLDGADNLSEYVADTDPNNSASVFGITNIREQPKE